MFSSVKFPREFYLACSHRQLSRDESVGILEGEGEDWPPDLIS